MEIVYSQEYCLEGCREYITYFATRLYLKYRECFGEIWRWREGGWRWGEALSSSTPDSQGCPSQNKIKKCTVTSWHANRPHDPRRPRITHHTIGPHQSRHPLQSRPPLETRQPRGPYDPHLPHATRWPWRTPTPRVSRQASWALKKKKSVPWYIYYIKVASTPRVSRQASPRQKKIWKVSALLNI